MLILTRRPGETLTIGDDITVTVIGIRGQQVKLGIAAPTEIPIYRSGLYERLQREKCAESHQAAAAGDNKT